MLSSKKSSLSKRSPGSLSIRLFSVKLGPWFKKADSSILLPCRVKIKLLWSMDENGRLSIKHLLNSILANIYLLASQSILSENS